MPETFMKRSQPRLMLAATKSGSGKTTVTCGLIRAMKRRERSLSVFKCGPDYIDPMFHSRTLGVKTGNLDSFFLDRASLNDLFERRSRGTDMTIMEGVMGYYDGLGGVTSGASSAEVAVWTRTPVILVVDVRGASLTLVPMLRGILYAGQTEGTLKAGICESSGDDGLQLGGSMIRGLLLNRASRGFYPTLKTMLEQELHVPVVGYLPVDPGIVVPSRHLGLYSPEELESDRAWADNIADAMEETVDLDLLESIAQSAEPIFCREEQRSRESASMSVAVPTVSSDAKVRIAVAKDEAFSFLYKENEELLERQGAEIIHMSPLHDDHFPQNVSGMILSGGYPELFAEELWKNMAMREGIAENVRSGMPTIAECGGFLYLMQDLKDKEGKVTPQAGIFDGHGFATEHLVRFGYCEAETLREGLFGPAGTKLRGHEFHYYDTTENGEGMIMTKPLSKRSWKAEIYNDHIAAGFPHFYYESSPDAAEAFLNACRRYAGAK